MKTFTKISVSHFLHNSYHKSNLTYFQIIKGNLWYHITQQINGTPKGVYWPISKLHSILAVANLLAHNNITIIYYGPVNSLRLQLSVVSKWASKHLWGYHLLWCWWYVHILVTLQNIGIKCKIDMRIIKSWTFSWFKIIKIFSLSYFSIQIPFV